MRFRNKRGQIFLLAAVIISVIVLSFGTISNAAFVSDEPINLNEFSYEVKRETGSVINYEIYTDFADEKLETFIDLFAQDLRDKDPFANFLFIYGDAFNLYIRNYGSEFVYVCSDVDQTCESKVPGGGTEFNGTITWAGFSDDITWTADAVSRLWTYEISSLGDDASITISFSGNSFTFPVEDAQQAIFVIQKEVDDENFIGVK